MNQHDIQFAIDRQQRIRQEAEQLRLIGNAQPSVNPVRRAISLTGDALIAVGTRLKERQPSPARQPRLIREIR